MLGHAKNLYAMYRFGKSVVNVDAFEKAKDKGIVGAKGESGIKILKGKGIKKRSKTYTHEIKVKSSEYGGYRIYRYKNENGNFIFDWFDKGKH
ncbi:hypothetical protein [Aneurinibacillus aneurinilyticus]|uniref:Uncharacterized protein n=1 Tax=Aneurinibacillus aneurinilyticus TaxID=1391 RepID=A0A848D5I2_ANEAE|nr:hypothetical protein [Aneurinibacillus aneurinilyticus]NMF01447.1 hypothetical protein [Aneurinibacillus aneurinilyticus]